MDAMDGFGTLAWARRNHGALSVGEVVREIAKGTLTLLRTLPAQGRQRLGLRNPRALAFDLDRLPIPDSRVAKEAEELCREASSPMLVNHCLRTYTFGMILAQLDGLRPDAELFYVASLLHDLALTERFRDFHPMPCFGARAGILAGDWARERGWDEGRCGTLADAICLHLNVAVPHRHGPEAVLLQAGAGLDVIGLRHWELAGPTVAAVVARYPRLAMKKAVLPLFVAESRRRTRTQLLNRWLMFGPLLRHSQFAE